MASKAAARNVTDADIAYRKLRDLIIRTELKPGDTLPESALMRRLGIGRTPLRDALHMLAHEELVEIWPRRGTFVSQITISDLHQIFEFRAALEQIVAHWVIARVTDADVAAVRHMASRARMNSGASDAALDQEFHRFLLSIANNRYLSESYQRLADASLRLLYLSGCGMESQDEQVRTFEKVADALSEKDVEMLAALLIDHVRAFRDRFSQSIFQPGESDFAPLVGTSSA